MPDVVCLSFLEKTCDVSEADMNLVFCCAATDAGGSVKLHLCGFEAVSISKAGTSSFGNNKYIPSSKNHQMII